MRLRPGRKRLIELHVVPHARLVLGQEGHAQFLQTEEPDEGAVPTEGRGRKDELPDPGINFAAVGHGGDGDDVLGVDPAELRLPAGWAVVIHAPGAEDVLQLTMVVPHRGDPTTPKGDRLTR